MDGTILGQGRFVANSIGLTNPNPGVASVSQANATIIAIPSGADWVAVRNYTKFGAAGTSSAFFDGTANASAGAEFFWQRGMAPGTGIAEYKGLGTSILGGDTLSTGGFTIYDPSSLQAGSQPMLGNPVAVTAVTDAVRPVVSTASTAGVFVGSVVRLSNTAQNNINSIDFIVGAVVLNTSFTLLFAGNALANVPGAIGGAGFYRIVNYPSLFYPRRRAITNISQAVNAQVSTALEHSMTVGQAIRFNLPAVSGMVQLNPTPVNNYLVATVVSIVDPYNFTIDIDSSAFTAFSWPTIAQQPASIPAFEPIGENSAIGLAANQNVFPQYQSQNVYNANGGVFADATINTGFYGMILGNGGLGLSSGTPISSSAVEYSMFYGLTAGTGMVGTDYAATVAVKTAAGTGRVPFPQNGPSVGAIVSQAGPSALVDQFLLPEIGTYHVIFRAHTTEPGQLQLELNGANLAATVAVNMNPTAGGHPIIGDSYVTTTVVNSILAVINSPGNAVALTITPADLDNTAANSQSITIERLIGEASGSTSSPIVILGPAGSISWSAGNVATGDVMYWVSGKAEFGGL